MSSSCKEILKFLEAKRFVIKQKRHKLGEAVKSPSRGEKKSFAEIVIAEQKSRFFFSSSLGTAEHQRREMKYQRTYITIRKSEQRSLLKNTKKIACCAVVDSASLHRHINSAFHDK